ncbi:MAG: zinc ABC transporter substrate-binding protein [Candidatus Riflebacteria bacterium]|nr:zinc ABC transporter substrate-binding protein [Candidatus Riflebacteria bacterium]
MFEKLTVTLFLAVCLGAPAVAAPPLRAAVTNSDLAAVTTELGGPAVEVTCLVPSRMNPHAMPLRPSMVQKVREADLLITIGLDHEPWLQDLTTASGNGSVQTGGPGYVDCSAGVRILRVPTGPVDRRAGDLHIFGNTHYWLDPANIRIAAVHILKALCKKRPDQTDALRDRARKFLTDLDAKMVDWKRRLAPFHGVKLVTYHESWPYLEAFAGFQVLGTVEMRPGIEPSPAHLAKLAQAMRQAGVKLLLMAPCYNRRQAESAAKASGAKVVSLEPSTAEGKRYSEHMEMLISRLEAEFKALMH